MQRKPNPRTLVAAFLTVSAALSIAVLALRNLYDDEIFSLDLITRPAREILAIAQESDVHPPGMYLLAHLAWRILPSFRWMNLFPLLVLYAGLAFFLLQIAPLFTRTRSLLCLLLLATLHPQLLLWGDTFRWYSWWTGLALIALTIALQPSKPRPVLGPTRAVSLGLLLAALFYLNYITLLFAAALAAAMFFRHRSQPPKLLFTRALITATLFVLLIAPQLRPMLVVHIPDGHGQRSSILVSVLRLLQSVATSETYLPWHPLAIIATLLFVALCIAGWIRVAIQAPGSSGIQPIPRQQLHSSPLAAIVLFGLLFFLLVAASGLGGRPRNGLLLIPVLAPAAALILETLRPRAQTAILLFFALWSAVGIAHLAGHYGLTKSEMNDRPEQVVSFIERNPTSTCTVVVTYDSALAFDLAQANLPRTLIISPYRGSIFGGAPSLPTEGCVHARLYAVQSYLSGSARRVSTYNDELQVAAHSIAGLPSIDAFSSDPDAPMKRRLSHLPGLGAEAASIARLPDDRYIVASGPIDGADLEQMRRRMPHFVSGYVVGPNEAAESPEELP